MAVVAIRQAALPHKTVAKSYYNLAKQVILAILIK